MAEDTQKFSLLMPPPRGEGGIVKLEGLHSVVLIGANGSGKTRLGVWLDERQHDERPAHRVSALRLLRFSDAVPASGYSQARKMLLYGNPNSDGASKRSRWGRKPATHYVDDYDLVLSLLFADETRRDHRYTVQGKKRHATHAPAAEVPDDKWAVVLRIWKECMPQRELCLSRDDRKVESKTPSGTCYAAQDMSDGERVTLYLLGEALCAPENAVVVIDEPEVHLHKAVLGRLWDSIERARPDCLFVYITHDPLFAASRSQARKVWVRSYDGSRWDWTELQPQHGIPEVLRLQLLGPRRRALLVEGEEESLDATIYRHVYPDCLVLPVGPSSRAIAMTKALRGAAKQFHHMSVYGLIDRDFRSEQEIAALERDGIYVLAVAEAENLFCLEGVVRAIASHLAKNPNEAVARVKGFVIDEFKNELEKQVEHRLCAEVRHALWSRNLESRTVDELQGALNDLCQMDIKSIQRGIEAKYQKAVNEEDYLAVLRFFKRKSLSKRLGDYFGHKQGDFIPLILRLMGLPVGAAIINTMRETLPDIPDDGPEATEGEEKHTPEEAVQQKPSSNDGP